MVWVILVLIYGILKGARDVFKKKALETSTVFEVLFLYTLISFAFVLPEVKNAGGMQGIDLVWIAVKSFMVFLAWIAGFNAVRFVPVSIYGIVDQSRIVFASLFGIIVLNETVGFGQVAGAVLVIGGMVLLKVWNGKGTKTEEGSEEKDDGREHVKTKYILMVLASSICNAMSGIMDKVLMSKGTMTNVQLQFWYMLFLVLYYLIYVLVKREKIRWKECLKNYWIWILAVLFVIADRCLFAANAYPESKVTIMTLIKQSSCVVTILGGWIVFKEKNIGRKFVCAAIVIAGILMSVLM